MKSKSSLKRLMDYAGKFKILTISSWILSAISALIALIPYYYIWKIIKEVIEVSPNFDEAVNLKKYGWFAVGFALLSMFIYICGLMCSHISAFRIASNIRREVLHHSVKLPLGIMEQIGSGRARKIINESSAATETYLAHQLPDKAGAIATPIGLIVLLVVFDWRLGLLSLIPIVLGFLIMMKMTGVRMETKMKEYQNSLEEMSNEAVEYVRGMPVVKTFGQTIFSFKRFKDAIDNYEKWVISYTKDLRMPMMLYTTAINSVFAFLIGAGIFFTMDGVTNEMLLNIIFYIIITPIISITLTKIMYSSENQMIVEDALKRIDLILNEKPLTENNKDTSLKDNSVTLRNVCFSYNGDVNVVHNISLDIKSGEKVAFVGPSGGGKTTLANLVSRFFDVTDGIIKIGGVDIKQIQKNKLMDTISFVFQDSKLLKTSILENVRIAKPNATDSEVMEAIEAAQCKDIIEKMPKGVHTVIGTKGVYLSGGEQQRLAIARVVLKNAPIIILDEATAFADPDNEVRIQKALSNLMQNKTVIMIAHRLSTVVNADKIFVLKNGKIVESGTHKKLLLSSEMYSGMWNDYNKSAQWKVAKEVL